MNETSPLKVAIIYTGQIRTLQHTLPYFIENVLSNKNHTHVFARIELPSSEEEKRYYEFLVRSKMGNHLKSLEWLDRNDSKWIEIRDRQVNGSRCVSVVYDHLKDYLKSSGSMIEHYQAYLCCQQIKSYESFMTTESGKEYKYDFVARVRTDIVLCSPLNFEWLYMDKEVIQQKVHYYKSYIIKENEIKENIDNDYNFQKKLLEYFMCSLVNEKRLLKDDECNKKYYSCLANVNSYTTQKDKEKIFGIKNNDNNDNNSDDNNDNNNDNNSDDNNDNNIMINIDELQNYLWNGDYIVIFRHNLVYFTSRNCFEKISTLGIEYGNYVSKVDPHCFWNSETQFQTICMDNDISIFNSHNKIEDVSLYEYEKSNYLDDNNKLIQRDDLFYFILRSF